MTIAPRAKAPHDLIDMTSMVDIVFFLLIFFLVTSMQALESTMDLPNPKLAASGMGRGTRRMDEAEYVQIRIGEDNSIWIEDVQTFGKFDMRERLKEVCTAGSHTEGAYVLGDGEASHGTAVDVFDACAGIGISKIMFAVKEIKN